MLEVFWQLHTMRGLCKMVELAVGGFVVTSSLVKFDQKNTPPTLSSAIKHQPKWKINMTCFTIVPIVAHVRLYVQ